MGSLGDFSRKPNKKNEATAYSRNYEFQHDKIPTASVIDVTSLYLVEGLVWWDWPFTWLTDQLLSFSA